MIDLGLLNKPYKCLTFDVNTILNNFKINFFFHQTDLKVMCKPKTPTIHDHNSLFPSIFLCQPDMCVIDQACLVNKFFFALLWTKTKLRSIKKKEKGQYPAILAKQAWSIMDLLYGLKKRTFSCGPTKVGNPGRAR